MFFLPGIVLSNSITSSSKIFNHTSFLFSGSLSKVTGIDLALKVFAKLPKLVLHISGKGELVDMVKQYSEKYSNIIYHGFMDVDSYKKMSKQIDFCLSLRNPSLPENRNNFPSKSLEYLSDAKILISTILYPELDGVKYVYSDYSEEALANVVVKLSQMDEDELKQYANNKDVLLKKISERAWKHAFEYLELNDMKNKSIFTALMFLLKAVIRDFSAMLVDNLFFNSMWRHYMYKILMEKGRGISEASYNRIVTFQKEKRQIDIGDVNIDEKEKLKRVEDIVSDIKNKTREDNIVFEYNCFYGFYRNLLGGIIISSLLVYFCSHIFGALLAAANINITDYLYPILLILFCVCVIFMYYNDYKYAKKMFAAYTSFLDKEN